MMAIRLAAVLAVTVLVAAAGAWAMDRPRRGVVVWTAVAVTFLALFVAPLAMPADRRPLRFVAGLVAVIASVKLFDAMFEARGGRRREKLGFWGFLAFLTNIFALVRRKSGQLPVPSRSADRAQLKRSALATGLGLSLFVVVFHVQWGQWPFAIEHGCKVAALFLVLIPISSFGAAGWRLLGGSALDFMESPLEARTPADFWRRYNRPAGQFLYENVFKPAGGRRRPVRAALVTFGVSAAVHEYLFSVTLGRIQGLQTAFFLIQGIAVVATMRVRPRGAFAVVGVAATLTFNLVTSMLFFTSLDQVVPFYSPDRPG
jgi:hypothetical protein